MKVNKDGMTLTMAAESDYDRQILEACVSLGKSGEHNVHLTVEYASGVIEKVKILQYGLVAEDR